MILSCPESFIEGPAPGFSDIRYSSAKIRGGVRASTKFFASSRMAAVAAPENVARASSRFLK
jgi:hypothetical protein